MHLTPLPSHPLLTIDDAIAANSFLENKGYDSGHVDELKQGDCDKGFAAAAHVVSGTVKTGAQEHFYMETMASVAVPEEDGRWNQSERVRARVGEHAWIEWSRPWSDFSGERPHSLKRT